jgi:hypothetical protein
MGDVDPSRLGKMIYDIVPLKEDWLVIGMTRGFFYLEVSWDFCGV